VRFVAGVLSMLPPRPLLWDEYYRVGRTQVNTPLRFVLQEEALRWAWYTLLAMIALFLMVGSRREQRPIPVVQPPRNATRELLHTIGRLYWHKGDHADLARRMIAHFKDDVRARTYLRTFAWDEATSRHLAAKCAMEPGEMARRMEALREREAAPHTTENELLALSSELHQLRQRI
jgi:hypothetical protein